MQKLTLGLALLMLISTINAQTELVSTEWLAKNLQQQNMVLVDMSDQTQYQRFHIPGAINLPYHYINQNVKRVSLSIGQPQLIKLLGQLGISQDSYVLVYDDTAGLHASRLIWELEQLGHSRMALLDGGLVKWIREGRKISYEPTPFKPVVYRAKSTGSHATATLQDVLPGQRDKNAILLDVRSEEEYIGNPRYPLSGHIPGAKWWEWDRGVNFDKHFTIQNKTDLKKELAGLGLTDPKQPVVVYCRSGHRASHAYFTLRQLGFENVRLYDGSIKEYEMKKGVPFTRGKQP